MPSLTEQQLQYNAQTKTRFILNMDLSDIIGDSAKTRNVGMSCYAVGTPDVSAGVVNAAFNGYQVPIPSGIRNEEKLLRVKWIVSEDMSQYAAMLKWINAVTIQVNEDQEVAKSIKATMDLWVLDSYLKPLPVPITFEGAWISRIGSLEFDQSDQTGSVLKCSSEFYYYRSTFDYDKVLGL